MANGVPNPICDGSARCVRFLVLPDGTAPVFTILEAMKRDRATAARAGAILKTCVLISHVQHPPSEKFRKFDDVFHEIRVTKYRVLTISEGRNLLLVHAFPKNENDADPKEVRTAERILNLYRGPKR